MRNSFLKSILTKPQPLRTLPMPMSPCLVMCLKSSTLSPSVAAITMELAAVVAAAISTTETVMPRTMTMLLRAINLKSYKISIKSETISAVSNNLLKNQSRTLNTTSMTSSLNLSKLLAVPSQPIKFEPCLAHWRIMS